MGTIHRIHSAGCPCCLPEPVEGPPFVVAHRTPGMRDWRRFAEEHATLGDAEDAVVHLATEHPAELQKLGRVAIFRGQRLVQELGGAGAPPAATRAAKRSLATGLRELQPPALRRRGRPRKVCS